MELPNSFEITLLKRIPYLTKALYLISTVCLIGILITSIYMLPARAATDEMKIAYIILYVPETVQLASAICAIGLVISLLLHFNLNKPEAAVLTFSPSTINIDGKNPVSIPIASIDKIYCSHIPARGRREDSLKLRIDRKNDKSIYFRLSHYLQIDEFMTQLTNYDNINLRLYNMDIGQNSDED